jgi:Flp pilus assembly protein TadB
MSIRPAPQSSLADDEREELGSAGARQRLRRRRRALRRLDILLGLIVGAVWLLVAPGVAMAGIVAALVLLVAGVSVLVSRRRGRRRRRRAAG